MNRRLNSPVILAAIAGIFPAIAAAADPSAAPPEMALIPAGVYLPLYRSKEDVQRVAVDAFHMDIHPVTNAQFLQFVAAQPRWRRSNVNRLMADERYLAHWAGDLEIGDAMIQAMPVTNVSWFAAKAYAAWKGKRLPNLAEWELAAAAGYTRPDGESEEGFNAQILQRYIAPQPPQPVGLGRPNYHGVHDLHTMIWEWVADFSTVMISGDSRSTQNLDRRLSCGASAQGARDPNDYPAFARFALRSSLKASYTIHNLGFRCVRSP